MTTPETADLIPIGDAARRLGVATSALRYYDERGLVPPATRVAGRRMYGPTELRRLAFVQMCQRLGLDLDAIEIMLADTGPPWQSVVDDHIAWLDRRIAHAEHAREILRHARTCPHGQPWRDCPYLLDSLDAWLGGEHRDELGETAGPARAAPGVHPVTQPAVAGVWPPPPQYDHKT